MQGVVLPMAQRLYISAYDRVFSFLQGLYSMGIHFNVWHRRKLESVVDGRSHSL